jgi:hypothetical protein
MVNRPGRGPASATVAVSLAIIAFFTLRPAVSPTGLPALCIICGPLGGVDFVLNTVLFVPLGAGLFWLTGRWKTCAIIGAATTLVIETLQWRVIPGRDASLGDLLANTIGTMLGAWLAVEGIGWLNATRSGSRRLAGVSGLVVSAVVVGSSWLVQPVQVRYPQWVQWKPVRRNMEPFQGQLSSVEFNGATLRPAQILRAREQRITRTVSVRAGIGSIHRRAGHGPSFALRTSSRKALRCCSGKRGGVSLTHGCLKPQAAPVPRRTGGRISRVRWWRR